MRTFAASILAIAVVLAGCGGPEQTPFPVESAGDTAVIQSAINVCTTTYTVHRDASAQRTSPACGSGTKTLRLASTLVSGLFDVLQAAQPLNGLQACLTVDTSLTVAWNSEQSPNLSGTCAGSDAAEQALIEHIDSVITTFAAAP